MVERLGSRGALARGGRAGKDNAKRRLGIVRVHLHGQLISGFEQRIADGLALFVLELSLHKHPELKNPVPSHLQVEVLFTEFPERSVHPAKRHLYAIVCLLRRFFLR